MYLSQSKSYSLYFLPYIFKKSVDTELDFYSPVDLSNIFNLTNN